MSDKAERGTGARNAYIVEARGKNIPVGKCRCCGEKFPLKSNMGIFEELWRIRQEIFNEPACPNPLCANHRVPVTEEGAYRRHGSTEICSIRYRCKACGGTFSVKQTWRNPIRKHAHSEKNRIILSMLMGKMPLKRILEATEIAPTTLYDRIDFFFEQSQRFLAERERHLPDMEIRRLYLGVDRQEYAVNWTRRADKRNTPLTAVVSADNATGYVFGAHPNFDPEMSHSEVEAAAKSAGDGDAPLPHRRFARLWLQADFDAAVAESAKSRLPSNFIPTRENIYEAAANREDVESSDTPRIADSLPEAGMLVHSEYTLYGHFFHLAHLLGRTGKVRFFLDQDSGMRAACLAAFAGRIQARTCDAFYVRIAKNLTVDEKRHRMNDARKEFRKFAEQFPDLDETAVKCILLKQRIAEAREVGPWRDRWVSHPLPTMAESEKAMCFLTDLGGYDEDHLAWLYNKASLHAVDSFFNRLRRRIAMLERPIASQGNRGRVWTAYSAYRPEQVGKLLTIARACHNYIWLPEDKSAREHGTPAVRLGLAKAPLDYNDIIYFQ